MEENKISKINKKYLAIGIVVAALATGSIGYMYTKHIVNEDKTELTVKNNVQDDIQATSTVIGYEMKTFNDIFGTTTLPYITQYENASTTKFVNDDIDEIRNTYQCFDTDSTKEYLIETLLDIDSSYKQKDLEKLSKNQLSSIFSKEKDWYSELNANNIYAKNDIFSFVYTAGSYCGGGHPSYGTYGVTYDLKKGKSLTLEDIFDDYTNSSVQEVFFEYYRKQISKQDPDEDSECIDSVDPGAGSRAIANATFYIADKDIVIIPILSHAETPCQYEVHVPLSSIMSRVKKDSILSRVSLK
jgi:hypothetical protein